MDASGRLIWCHLEFPEPDSVVDHQKTVEQQASDEMEKPCTDFTEKADLNGDFTVCNVKTPHLMDAEISYVFACMEWNVKGNELSVRPKTPPSERYKEVFVLYKWRNAKPRKQKYQP